MLKSKKFLFVAAFLLLSLFLVACGSDNDDPVDDADDNGEEIVDEDDNGDEDYDVEEDEDDEDDEDDQAAGEQSAQDELAVAIAGNIGSRDPHASNDTPSAQVNRHVFGRLVEQDYHLDIHPSLAESWEQIDDRVWEFNLRQGVTFHNGTPLTAHDVAFTMERAANAGHVAPILGMIDVDTIEVVDDYTIRLGTDEPFAPFLAHLAHPAASILSAEAVGDTDPDDTEPEQLVGSGPYQITELMVDSHIILERWDGYHGELPNMRIIDLRMIIDAGARLTALETGAVDIALNPGPADVARILADENMYTATTQSLGIEYMGMNFNHDYLGIPEVRQAINYALDTDTIVAVSTEDTATPLATFIPSNVFGFNPNVPTRDYNIARAEELMAEAGVSGFDMVITVNQGNVARLAAAEIIQNQLQPLNINVEIIQLEWAAYLEALDENDFDAFMAGWGVVTGDADYGLYPLFHSAYHPASNRVAIASSTLDGLLESARATTVDSERIDYYFEAQEYLYEAAPFVLLGNNNLFVPMQLNVRNFVVMPHQSHYFGDVYFVD